MKKHNKYTWLLSSVLLFSGCESFFDPEFHNNMTEETVLDHATNPKYIEGLYVPAYGAIPGSYMTFGGDFLDCATDNAVSNVYTSSAYKLYTIPGYFTYAPVNVWNSRYRYIKDIHKFLAVGLDPDIIYRTSTEARNEQLKKRMEGEAYFLLGLNYFQLLRDHAGPVDGKITGVPLIKEEISVEAAKEQSRAEYLDVLDYIVESVDNALASEGLAPEYSHGYANSHDNMDPTIYGDGLAGLPTTTACHLLKSRALLYAASPAYSKGMDKQKVADLYTEAAKAAKAAIDIIGELQPELYSSEKKTLPNNSIETIDDRFFMKVDNNPELILRRAGINDTWEKNNYPPSMGIAVQGRTNPSQNLVDAFPMANGYPISDATSQYDANDPYAGRDPRFYMTVLYNNVEFKGTNIQMWAGGDTWKPGNSQIGAPNISDDSRISRTNYYLRKWITEKPIFKDGVKSEKPWHFAAVFRAVEAYLNFAEAANAAVGPDVPIEGLTAREALRAIRYRAGIPTNALPDVASDPYLASTSNLADLIKNERRIELCFEGHRYYDVRRWNDDMNVTVRKAEITTTDGATFTYNFNQAAYPGQVEIPDYMRYGSIPRGEVMVCPNLTQNDGWN